jgi:hypothetical protein
MIELNMHNPTLFASAELLAQARQVGATDLAIRAVDMQEVVRIGAAPITDSRVGAVVLRSGGERGKHTPLFPVLPESHLSVGEAVEYKNLLAAAREQRVDCLGLKLSTFNEDELRRLTYLAATRIKGKKFDAPQLIGTLSGSGIGLAAAVIENAVSEGGPSLVRDALYMGAGALAGAGVLTPVFRHARHRNDKARISQRVPIAISRRST